MPCLVETRLFLSGSPGQCRIEGNKYAVAFAAEVSCNLVLGPTPALSFSVWVDRLKVKEQLKEVDSEHRDATPDMRELKVFI
jgi:hypothetical protein